MTVLLMQCCDTTSSNPGFVPHTMLPAWIHRGVGRGGAEGAAVPPPPKKKKRRGRGESKRERKKKEKRGFKGGRKLNKSFQEHVFMGLE